MEIKATLNKPFTEEEQTEFIMYYGQDCWGEFGQCFEIIETEEALEAWGYTEAEKQEQERERINNLTLTRGDVFSALIQARMIDENMLKAQIEAEMPETTDEEKKRKMLAINALCNALNFHRGHDLVNIIGAELGISEENLDLFFETGDYHYLEALED